jgi:hypothetical protein
VKTLNKAFRFCRLFLFAFMFAVCMVMGIAPIIPKRKEEQEVEIKIEQQTTEENTEEKTNIVKQVGQ